MNTILFDMGGVLAVDVWETLLLTPKTGLVDRLKLNHDQVKVAGRELWEYCSVRQAIEEEYWSDLEEMLSVKIPRTIIKDIEENYLQANPAATKSLVKAKALGFRIGVISNNTSFWYQKQAKLIDIEYFCDPEIIFLSFNYGVQKKTLPRGLFHIAANIVDPLQTYIIDDSMMNIKIAEGLGFSGIQYRMNNKSKNLESIVASLA